MSEIDALEEVLADEHAAVYVLGVLGARTSESAAPAAYAVVRGAYEAHRRRRDRLAAIVTAGGGDAVVSETAYEVPDGLGSVEGVLAAGRAVEDRSAAVYASAVAATTGDHRALLIEALNDAAVRFLAFRGTPEMFPGADEFTDR